MDIFFAFIASLLTGLGIGSGGLLVIYLTFFGGYVQIEAQAVNLLFFISAAAIATLVNLIKKRIYFLPSVILTLFGTAGALLGTVTAVDAGSSITRKIFGGFMLAAGVYGLLSKKND